MAAITLRHRPSRPMTFALHTAIVSLTLATAAIHWSLGGVLFTLNAIGYAVFAAALVVPGPFAKGRSLVRYGLIGFTTATILGWVAFGARFDLAYIDKAIEAALVGLLLIESWVIDGSPLAVVRRVHRIATSTLR